MLTLITCNLITHIILPGPICSQNTKKIRIIWRRQIGRKSIYTNKDKSFKRKFNNKKITTILWHQSSSFRTQKLQTVICVVLACLTARKQKEAYWWGTKIEPISKALFISSENLLLDKYKTWGRRETGRQTE